MEKVIESMSQKDGVNGEITSSPQLAAHNFLRSRKPKIKSKSKVTTNTNSNPNSPCTNSTTSDNDDVGSIKDNDIMVKNGAHASSTKVQVAALEANNVKKATNRYVLI